MNFLILLMAVALEFTLASFATLRDPRWSEGWARWCLQAGRRFGRFDGVAAALLILLLPVVISALLVGFVYQISPFLFALVSLMILLLTLGPQDLDAALAAYKNELSLGRHEAAATPEFVQAVADLELGVLSGDVEFDLHRHELAGLALSADRAWFQPLVWFFIAGPVAVIAYRLAANLRADAALDKATREAIERGLAVAEFIPLRISACVLGLVGTLVPVVELLRAPGWFRWDKNAAVFGQAALAAIDNGRIREVISGDGRVYRLNQMYDLLKRGLGVWLLLFAILTLLGF